mmetsp:Transcript_68057/g.131406  ORF Transcript_68057/g.131406 Transcript_68057/m.131406 type:complete len:113 (+) Transcript_68057:127-465(+)
MRCFAHVSLRNSKIGGDRLRCGSDRWRHQRANVKCNGYRDGLREAPHIDTPFWSCAADLAPSRCGSTPINMGMTRSSTKFEIRWTLKSRRLLWYIRVAMWIVAALPFKCKRP